MRIPPPASTVHTSTSHVLIASRHPFHSCIAFFPHRIPASHLRLYHYLLSPESFLNIPNIPLISFLLSITCIHMRHMVCSLPPVYRHRSVKAMDRTHLYCTVLRTSKLCVIPCAACSVRRTHINEKNLSWARGNFLFSQAIHAACEL